MRAALLVAPGRVIVDDVPDEQVGPDDVQIQVGGVGLCGSDASVFSGKWPTPSTPWIMGHEAFGKIVAVGERVPEERIGEIVVVEPNLACFRCGPCQLGLTSACENRLSVGMNRPGALAERLVVPSRFAWRVDGLEPETLVCIEPLTVVEAALRRMSRELPNAALVVGAGPQGLLMCLALMMRGVEVHCPGHESRAPRIRRWARRDDRTDRQEVRSGGRLASALRQPMSRRWCIALPAATILVLGLDERPLGLSARTLVRRQLELRGSLTYDHPVDFRHIDRAREQRKARPRPDRSKRICA